MRRVRLSRAFYRTLIAILVVAVGIGAFIVWAHRQSPEDALYVPAEANITPEVEMLRDYLRIDTTNPPGNEIEGARFLVAELRKRGIEPEVIESAPGRASVYARLKGRRQGEGLMLLSHIDVVPADPTHWRYPPFGGVVELNQIWGRGALDMKSITICHLLAFADAAAAGELERDLVFLSVADEEEGGTLGMEWIVENRPDVIEGIRYAVNEGGITETVAGEIVYFGIEIGSKPMTMVQLRSDDREVLREIRIELEPYFEPWQPERILPEVREFFRAAAPYRIRYRELLTDVDTTIAAGDFWLLHESYRELTANTIKAGGVTPHEDGGYSMDVFLSNLPDEDPEARLAFLRELVGGRAEVDVMIMMEPSPLSSTRTPFFGVLRETIRDHFGEVEVGPLVMRDIATDSRFLRSRGIDAYGFWPYPVDFFQTLGIHDVDERLRVDWFLEGIDLMRELVRAWT